MADGNFLYLKLYNSIKDDIERGKYAPGAKLPPEAELRKAFSISAITVKKAFTMLAEEGLVRRVPGRGTFVKGGEPEKAEEPAVARNPRLIGMILEHVATPYGLDMLYTIDRLLSARGFKLCVRAIPMRTGTGKRRRLNFCFLSALRDSSSCRAMATTTARPFYA